MHPRVAKLYLAFMQLAPHAATFCGSTTAYRAAVQEGFSATRVVPGTPEFAHSLAKGRSVLGRLQDLITVRKYRAMMKRYSWSSYKNKQELVALLGETKAQSELLGLNNRDVYGYDDHYCHHAPSKPMGGEGDFSEK
ncbi:uncharacterized protein TEOVI_000411900 [Trypanosoma equiperdum]|uniref:Uncharacterized protein n=1 Tax=Trypanosoma equiperdum TaxID=5694 RepID=A0A1G4IJK8_TRYEQ|nr:hypothetical protein, conserved [Trypanosoma equiperdum]